MQTYYGYSGKLLDINLSNKSISHYTIPPRWITQFLGGRSLAARILLDELPTGIDPLGEENILCFTLGTLTGSGAPCSSRYNLSTKNVLTGGIASSNCGGEFGIFLRRAGYDGLIIRGKAKQPTIISIDNDTVAFRDGRHVWGLACDQTRNRLRPKHQGCIVIGPAGENLVRFANIMDGHRTLGRTGVGAVMGSKLLKAIIVSGNHKFQPMNKEAFQTSIKEWTTILRTHPITGEQLPRFGTAGLTNLTNATNTLAVRNFSKGHDPRADQVSGETMAETILTTNKGCRSCPIRCAREIELDGKTTKGVEFETLGMFGPNIENFDQAMIARLGKRCDELGMDTITAGSTIAFAMELTEKGMLNSDLAFGKTDNLLDLLEDIATRQTPLGNDLAEGSMRLSQKYGGEDFAMHVKGLEMAAYEPRGAVGQGLGYAVSNRGGCHINGGYLVFFEALGPIQLDPLTSAAKPALTIFQQNVFDAVTSAGTCVFTTYAVIPGGTEKVMSLHGPMAKAISSALKLSRFVLNHQSRMPSWMIPMHLPLIPHTKAISALLDRHITLGDFITAGERGYTVEKIFNLREGLTAEDDQLPKRLTHEAQDPTRPETKVPMDEMLPEYYSARGWDYQGIPKDRLLKKLDLAEFLPMVYTLRKKHPSQKNQHDSTLPNHLEEIRHVTETLEEQRNQLGMDIIHAERTQWAKQVQHHDFYIDPKLCQSCGLCKSPCPVEAISWKRLKPATIDQQICIKCGTCYTTCPPHFKAVVMTPPANSQKRPIYTVNKEKCSKCGICARKCPAHAIRWKKGDIAVIDEELCVRCGHCHTVCPDKFDAIDITQPQGAQA